MPDKLAILGFDNQPIAQVMKLTTFDMPLTKMGINLSRQAMNPRVVNHEEVYVKIVEREIV
ncbi:hypothetical protein B481_3454 [Planococcus halocryophilus Or1]|nr:hypothetical protein B481_3454 [Planococcus halocryophilus Or1]